MARRWIRADDRPGRRAGDITTGARRGARAGRLAGETPRPRARGRSVLPAARDARGSVNDGGVVDGGDQLHPAGAARTARTSRSQARRVSAAHVRLIARRGVSAASLSRNSRLEEQVRRAVAPLLLQLRLNPPSPSNRSRSSASGRTEEIAAQLFPTRPVAGAESVDAVPGNARWVRHALTMTSPGTPGRFVPECRVRSPRADGGAPFAPAKAAT